MAFFFGFGLFIVYYLCISLLISYSLSLNTSFFISFGLCIIIILIFIYYISIKGEIIFHDIGEEIDDEIGIYKYFNYLRNNLHINRNIYIVATNGVYKAKLNSNDRNKIFYNYFPEYVGQKSFKVGNSTIHILSIDEANKMSGYTLRVLQIAPLTGLQSSFFEKNTITSRVLMGECLPVPSINTNKSWCNNMDEKEAVILNNNFLEQNYYLDKIPTRYITTTLARKVPFSFESIDSLPNYFKDPLFDKIFKLFVGRVHPSKGFCENVTCGANHPTVLSYMNAFGIINLNTDMDSVIKEQIDVFMSKMKCNDKEKMFNCLFDINRIVYIITGNIYSDANLGFSADSLENYDESFNKFMNLVKKYKPTLTPAYDVLAMYDFIYNTHIEKDYIISVSECNNYTIAMKNF